MNKRHTVKEARVRKRCIRLMVVVDSDNS